MRRLTAVLACALAVAASTTTRLVDRSSPYQPPAAADPTGPSTGPSTGPNVEGADLVEQAYRQLADFEGEFDCHDTAHQIGRRIAEQAPLKTIVAVDDGLCLGGFAHGATEHVVSTWDESLLISELDGLCALGDAWRDGSCGHGIGHAAALRHPDDFVAALDVCHHLVEPGHVEACAGGVTMAFITDRTVDGDPAALRGDPRDVCQPLTPLFRRECWAKTWALVPHLDPEAQLQLCYAADDPRHCAEYGVGAGMLHRRDFRSLDDSALMDLCADATLRDACQTGIGWARANIHVGIGLPADEYVSVCHLAADPDRCRGGELNALGAAPDTP